MNTTPLNDTTPSCNLPDVGSRLARGSAADLDRLTKRAEAIATLEPAFQPSPSKEEHPAKRKRGDPLSESQQGLRNGLGSSRPNTGHSRDLMPPPPSPRRPYGFTGHVPTPNLVNSPFVPTARRPPTATLGPGPTTPRRQISQAQDTGLALNGNELNHHSSVDFDGTTFQHRPNHRSSLSSVEALERTPRRNAHHFPSVASMSSFEKRPPRDQDLNTACRIQLPAPLGALPTNTGNLSSQVITNGSLYPDRNLLGPRRLFEALSHPPRIARRQLPNASPGRLTLTPRYSNQQRHGLVANVRTSNDRPGTAASPHFGKQYHPHSSWLTHHNSHTRDEHWRHIASFDAGLAPAAGIRYVKPFESGPTAVNGQMRPYSSTPHPKNFLLAQDPSFGEATHRREQALRTQLTPAERGIGPATPAAHGSFNVTDPRDSAPASRSGRRTAQR